MLKVEQHGKAGRQNELFEAFTMNKYNGEYTHMLDATDPSLKIRFNFGQKVTITH